MSKTRQLISAGALLFVLSITLVAYWPGLKGPMVLDDVPNLKTLDIYGPVTDLPTFYQFIFAKSSTYPKRPLSYASFLINDHSWPLYVPSHKYTNLLIHLINGVLVFWLSWLICRLTDQPPGPTAGITVTATALWLLAPLQVSTVLYLIQRMTELSALFVLCGLITYCYGRRSLNQRPVSALVQMTAGVAVFGALGFLFKENAVLLTLYILVLEYTLLKSHLPVDTAKVRRSFTLWKWLVLAAPITLVFARLIYRGIFAAYEYRPYDVFERIASQPRIIFDYLQNLLIPVRQGMGVTHDDYILSTGVLTPPTTLLSIVALICLIGVAFYLGRRSATYFGFAVLWFLAGHALESSIIPLEPYFEHRNYLSALGPFFSLSWFVWTTRLEIARYLKIALILYLGFFTGVTKLNVDIWSSKALMADVWTRDHPTSVRAHQLLADLWSRLGHHDKAGEVMNRIALLRPEAMGAQIQTLLVTCRDTPETIDSHLETTKARIPGTHYDNAAVSTLFMLRNVHDKKCPELSSDDLLELVDTVLANETVARRSKAVSDFLYLKAVILLDKGEIQNTVAHLYSSFHQTPNYRLGLMAVRLLYGLGEYEEAMKALEDVQELRLKPWSPDNFKHKELQTWKHRIQYKLKQQDADSPTVKAVEALGQ